MGFFIKSLILSVLIFNICFISNHVLAQLGGNSPIVFDGNKYSDINLYVQNGCSNYLVIIGNNGKPETDLPPTIGALCNPSFSTTPLYISLDTLLSAARLVDVINMSEPFGGVLVDDTSVVFVATDSILYKYEVGSLINVYNQCDSLPFKRVDSLFLSDIQKLSFIFFNPENLLLIIYNFSDTSKANLQVRYINDLSLKFELKLDMIPKDIYSNWNGIYVVGALGDSTARLLKIDIDSQNVSLDIVLNSLSSNPISISRSGGYMHILSAPGDSFAAITRFSLNDSSLTSTILYNQSGCKAFAWEPNSSNLYCQPMIDTTGNDFNKQILKFQADSMKVTDIYYINKDVYSVQYPISGGFSSSLIYLNVLDTSFLSTAYVYYPYMFIPYDTITTGYRTYYINNEIRCAFASIDDNNKSHIKFNTFPNPTGDYINLVISGVPSNKKCKLEIFDILGKTWLSTQVKVKTKKIIQLAHYPPGIYFLSVQVDNVMVRQKIVKL